MRTSVTKFSNKKKMECKKPSTCNRNCSEERVSRNPHKHFWLWGNFWLRISQEKKYCKKVLQRWAWEIELIACYITVRIPPNSLISPGCCILRVCAPAGVYKRVGPPAFLTFCFIPMSTKRYVIGDGNNACILVRNSYTKGLTKCYTDSGHTFRQIL